MEEVGRRPMGSFFFRLKNPFRTLPTVSPVSCPIKYRVLSIYVHLAIEKFLYYFLFTSILYKTHVNKEMFINGTFLEKIERD